MAASSRPDDLVPAAIRILVGAAALLGLFAMHGMSTHGSMHRGLGADAVAAAVLSEGHEHHSAEATTPTASESSPATSRVSTSDAQQRGLIELCMAVLLAGVLASLLRRRRARAVPGSRPAAWATAWPNRARRDPDPPCLFTLSIQRC